MPLLKFNRHNLDSRDVWEVLQTNWSNFFWLTGDTPRTLQVIVNGIEQIYLPQRSMGRPSILTFRNQVSCKYKHV